MLPTTTVPVLGGGVHSADVVVDAVQGTDAHRAQAGQHVRDGPRVLPHRRGLRGVGGGSKGGAK